MNADDIRPRRAGAARRAERCSGQPSNVAEDPGHHLVAVYQVELVHAGAGVPAFQLLAQQALGPAQEARLFGGGKPHRTVAPRTGRLRERLSFEGLEDRARPSLAPLGFRA